MPIAREECRRAGRRREMRVAREDAETRRMQEGWRAQNMAVETVHPTQMEFARFEVSRALASFGPIGSGTIVR